MTSKILCLAFSSVFLAGWTQAQTVSVADAGIRPDTYENATPRVQRILSGAAAGTTVAFPKGRYDFWPDGAVKAKYFISNTSTEEEDSAKLRNIGLYLKKARNITIDGNGSLFVFHGKMTTILVDSSENITLRNIRVDFERPTMSEMRIVGPQGDGTLVDIHPDARNEIRDGHLLFYGEGWKTSHFHAVCLRLHTGNHALRQLEAVSSGDGHRPWSRPGTLPPGGSHKTGYCPDCQGYYSGPGWNVPLCQ